MTDHSDNITKAIKQVFDRAPETFHANRFCEAVRRMTYPKAPMDTTILRILRNLRQQGKINYLSVDRKTAKYQKAA